MRSYSSRYLFSAISGLALVFAFAPFDVYPLAWVALVPFFLAIKDLPMRQSFKAGFMMGMFYFFGTTYWIYHSMHEFGGIPLVPSLLIVILLACYLSLYTAVFAVIFNAKIKNTRLPALMAAPVVWVTLEYIRSYALTGFPWSTLGYTQWNFLPAIQIADITGVYGVSFLVVAVNAAIADFFIIRWRTREMPLFPLSYNIAAYSGFVFLMAFTFLYGHMRLGQQPQGRKIRASVVQGDIDQGHKWDAKYEDQVFKTYKDLTYGALFQAPNIVVWPESSLPFPFDERDPRVKELESVEQASSTPFLIGAIRQKQDGKYANSAILLDAGKPAFLYDKIHMVPFGEYVPLKRVLFFVNKMTDAIGDYEPGKDFSLGSIKQGEFGTLICYEIVFPGLVRKFFKDGGDFLVTITNDAWFGRSTGPYQHFSMAVLRAVENRKPIIRAANTGVSGFISSSGAVIKRTSLFERGTLTADIVTDHRKTFYSRFGDLFSYVCILSTLFITLLGREEKEKKFFQGGF
ncbi:MAG: apolipoprotein N-acyltransferase [Nitrospiraceae bacterium]|nr:apolipoprotein N-acyltransferase [Nitrospiraceae bacterium]